LESDKKVVLDTNLFVRYLTDDDPQKAAAVDSLLERALKRELQIVVPSIVIAELVWVLESFYQMAEGDIAGLVSAIMDTPGVKVNEKPLINAVLKLYRTSNIDLVDAWIIEFARARGIKTIYTFDKKHFKHIEGVETKTPL